MLEGYGENKTVDEVKESQLSGSWSLNKMTQGDTGYMSKDVKNRRNRAQKKGSMQREQQVQKPWSRIVSACSGTRKLVDQGAQSKGRAVRG